MARVLVLRESQDAARTAGMLRARGHEPLLLPLQEVRPLDPPIGDEPVGGFLATSAHAAPWIARKLAASRAPVVAVGERTAEALRERGVAEVLAGPGRAADLVPLAAAIARRDAPLVYAAGRVRLSDLELGLHAAGVPFRTLEVYAMADRRPDDTELERVRSAGPPDAVLLLSRRQAELFEDLVARCPALLSARLRALCLSEAVAGRLHPDRRPEWGAMPTLTQLLARLD